MMPGTDEAELQRLRDELARAAATRDELLQRRSQLLLQMQVAQRPGGVRVHSAQGPTAVPFPASALPNGTFPTIHVIDVGAQELTTEKHAYQPLVELGIAHVVGFEPLEDAAAKRLHSEPNVTMLNYFIGDGTSRRFHINAFDPTSSLFPANFALLDRFEHLSAMCAPVKEIDVTTTRLDDVAEIQDCDFLKIDVQGGELDVLLGGHSVVEKASAIHCEVEFDEVYSGQPLAADIHSRLRSAGFELIDLVSAGYNSTRDIPWPVSRSRLLWCEAIYFRTAASMSDFGADKILRAALIAHMNYAMYDLAAAYLSLIPAPGPRGYGDLYREAMAAARSA